MCNPPFFDEQEMDQKFSKIDDKLCNSSDESTVSPPKSSTSARPHEIFTEDGEVEFVSKILNESFIYKDQIRIYTTMLGKKSSIQHLKTILKDKNIKHKFYAITQGCTRRWFFTWSFLDTVEFPIIDCS